MFKKEFSLCFILVISCFFFSTSVECATYRLIPENFLAIDNHWEYQLHITKYDGVPKDWWGTSVWHISGDENISGFNTKILQKVNTVFGGGSWTEQFYWYLSLENLVEVRWEEDDEYETARKNDPWEIRPIWVSDTDIDRHVGHGQYTGSDGDEGWTGYNDYYITYLRQETITVPAGTFNCIVVLIYDEWHDDSGWLGHGYSTIWMSPSVGIIKLEVKDWEWDNDYQAWYDEIETVELTSTNIQPSIAKDLTFYDFNDSGNSTHFHIWNDGTGKLDYNVSISEGSDYFTVSPLSGSSINSDDKKTHTVTVNRTNIPPGQTVMGKVKVSSNEADDSPQYINLSAQRGVIKSMPWIPLLLFDDNSPPTVPTGLVANAVPSGRINLSWNASIDNVSVTGYKIYRDGAYLKSVTATSTTDTGLNASTRYCYTVSAYDADGNESGQSDEVCETTDSTSDTYTNSLGMTFKLIPAGSFTMGSPSGESGRYSNETQHQVTLTQSFYMQTTEVTQGQWKAVMGSNPSHFSSCGSDCPVERVSWNDVQAFITTLNNMGQGTYRLPTEAEWEYAARAGSTTAFANGGISVTGSGYDPNLDAMGWYLYNSGFTTHPVAQKQANAWGLYDMHGNVREWCQDWYGDYPSSDVTDPTGPSSGSFRMSRGGSWNNFVSDCRSACRLWGTSIYMSYKNQGFRLVRNP